MKNSTIHIRLEHAEAVEAKKDILSSEMNLLRIAKEITKYKALRKEELGLKLKLSKKIKEAKTDLNKLKRTLPKPEIPEILKEHLEEPETEEIKDKIEQTREKQHSDDIESELQEIQDKLNALRT